MKLKGKAFGTYTIAKICHVAPITVGRWIEEGKLPYFTTGGGHRRVWDSHLVKFLRAHNYPIPKDLKSGLSSSILIVDDDAATRRLLRRTLEKAYPQVQVHEAVDGFEAGEKIFNLLPSVVILDVWLPGMDGIKVCERIRQNKAMKVIKIIAVTGEQVEETRRKILSVGADAFLAKPFTMDGLVKIVAKFIKTP